MFSEPEGATQYDNTMESYYALNNSGQTSVCFFSVQQDSIFLCHRELGGDSHSKHVVCTPNNAGDAGDTARSSRNVVWTTHPKGHPFTILPQAKISVQSLSSLDHVHNPNAIREH